MQHLEQAVQQRLSSEGIRLTRGRRATLQAIADSGGPRTAAEIQTDLSETIQHDAEGIMRFELAEWLAGHHHHLVCISCGAAADVVPSSEQEHAIEQLIEQMAAASGFAVTGHRFEIEGRCASCR